jgi:hypothetical protein
VILQLQRNGWPICACADELTRYLGHPANRASFADFIAPGAYGYDQGVLAGSGRLAEYDPEDWADVCCFACPRCGARFFTDQFT